MIDTVPPYLIAQPKFVLWRLTPRIDKKTGETHFTKIPISYHNTRKACDITKPASWTSYANVAKALELGTGAWDGAGFVLGMVEALDEVVIGADLDTCLNPDGTLADWAPPYFQAMPSYAEVSPSRAGIKIIARIRGADLAEARRLLDIAEGDKDQARTRIFGERVDAQHAPGVQFFLMSRYFTITGQHWASSPEDIALLELDHIALLAKLFGPKSSPRAKRTNTDKAGDEPPPDDAALNDKLGVAFIQNPRLRHRWQGGTEGLKDITRSGRDMSVLAMLKVAEFSRAESYAALCEFAHGKMTEEDERYFERMWTNSIAEPHRDPEPPPNWDERFPPHDSPGRGDGQRQSDHDPEDPPDHEPEEGGGVHLTWAPIRPIEQTPPRQWAYGHFLLFGSAAVIGALDGTGKGFIAVIHALEFITGKSLLGERVWRTGKVAIITYEDDTNEWCRRFAAACKRYHLDHETVMQSVAFFTKIDGRVVLAQRAPDGGGVIFPDSDRIIQDLKAHDFALLIIDPFNSAHAMEDGNNNVAIAAVAQEVTHIAQAANVVALVLHHLRKGSSGDVDDLMGATMLRANFRSTRILIKMTEDEAQRFGIPRKEHWRFIRIAGTKDNYAPRLSRAVWFKLESIDLGNPAGIYTEGDDVGVIVSWAPPPIFAGMVHDQLVAVFDALGKTPHGRNPKVAVVPWAGTPLMELAERSEEQARQIVAAWIDNRVLIEGPDTKSSNRTHVIKTLILDRAKAAEILGAGAAKAADEWPG